MAVKENIYIAKYRLVAIWVNYEQACDMKMAMYTL